MGMKTFKLLIFTVLTLLNTNFVFGWYKKS